MEIHYIVIIAILLVVICILAVKLFDFKHKIELNKIFFNDFTEKNNQLQNNVIEAQNAYNSLKIENAKLTERVVFLSTIEEKYNSLLSKYNLSLVEISELKSTLENERKNIQEKIELLQSAEKMLSDKFSALSAQALSRNNQSFLELAKTSFENLKISAKKDIETGKKEMADIVSPIQKTLTDVDAKLQLLEKDRIAAFQSMHEQVKSLLVSQKELKDETNKLSSALKVPNIRGKWGEMQLRRVVEIAGMVNHCDFEEQVTVINDANEILRPDMVIYMSGGKNIVVDAKTPLYAYSAALDAENQEDKKRFLLDHAKHVRHHCTVLGSKKYLDQFGQTPDFVVMFLPGEIFFSAAIEQDPSLIEFAMERRVVIATPTTLLALLHAVAMGWKNEALSENAKNIVKLGKELYKRLADMSEHITRLGKNINSTVDAYNSFSSTMERRVLVSVRKFNELESEKALLELPEVHNLTSKQ